MPSIRASGWNFLSSSDWDPVKGIFGSVPFVYGTIVSSLIALLIATPFGLGISLFLTELAPLKLRDPVAFIIEILAAIPSVVFGLWGIFLLAPFMRVHVDPFLAKLGGLLGLPFFKEPSTGLSLFTAGVILSIMILPTITAISREVFESIPNSYRESAKAIGATNWETILLAVVQPSKVGVLGAIMLALGRALGETMAVTMVIGNRPEISKSLFAPGYTMASVIANEFTEATGNLYLSALVEIALVLLLLTVIVNGLARLLIWSITRGTPSRV